MCKLKFIFIYLFQALCSLTVGFSFLFSFDINSSVTNVGNKGQAENVYKRTKNGPVGDEYSGRVHARSDAFVQEVTLHESSSQAVSSTSSGGYQKEHQLWNPICYSD